MDKSAVRKQITDKKNALTTSEVSAWSQALKEKFCALPVYQKAECIYFYMNYNNEVQTVSMIEQALRDGKRAAVPIMLFSGKSFNKKGEPKSDYMEFVYLKSMDECEPNFMGIPEPPASLIENDPARIADEKEVLILMPGLGFDKSCNRIGYGGGFYDKYLSSHTDTHFTKIALCFDFQIVDALPVEPHDEKMDMVISPSYTVCK